MKKELHVNRNIAILLSLFLSLAITSCVPVKLIADYDEQLDKGVTEFQKSMENHLTTIESQIGGPAVDYKNYLDFYKNAKVELSALSVRAAAQGENEISVQQLDLMSKNLALLETAHKEGLKKNDIPPFRNAFNVGATAILKLELAKKRGE